MKKWLCVIWCFISAPLSFFIGWAYDWSLGGAIACWIGSVGGIFLFISAILLLCNKVTIAKSLGFVGCGVNLSGFVIVCTIGHDVHFPYCLIAYLTITLFPFLLFLSIKQSPFTQNKGTV